MTRSYRIAFIAVLLCGFALAGRPALADPSTLEISNVFQKPCEASRCDTGTDRRIAPDGTGADTIQIQVKADDSLGLASADLQARLPSGSWVCLERWTLDGAPLPPYFNWNTNAWPDTCPGAEPSATKNGTYPLRLLVRERVTGSVFYSATYTVRVSNAATPPSWAGDLDATGEAAREPLVELSFTKAPEPDVFEYHYVRLDPDGSESEWAVSAAKPGGQGCDLSGDTYTCYDDAFTATGFGGKYTYVLVGLRQTTSGSYSCALPPNPLCVASPVSEPRTVTLNEPVAGTPAPGSGTSTGGSPSSRPITRSTGGAQVLGSNSGPGGASSSGDGFTGFFSGSYDPTLPYSGQQYAVPRGGSSAAGGKTLAAGPGSFPGGSGAAESGLWQSVAGGLVLLLAAAHVARLLKRA